MPLPENLPRMSWGVTVVQLKPERRGSVCRLWMQTTAGEYLTVRTWEWDSNRPTPAQLEDLTAATCAELTASIVAFIGVQGVLTG